MSFTQFSMVEELASLVKDNLPCKHLVLSVEEALLNLLQDETSSDAAVLELEPMNPYNRLLIHRLADIFGFSHHSVGEGDERHIVLQRCPDSSIPSMLVIDLLWEYDEQYARLPDVQAKPSESSHGYNIGTRLLECSLKERQEAYMAARERIFSVDDYEIGEPLKQRPPKNPVVARRMIVHALGRQARSSTEDVLLRDSDSSSNNEILNEKQKESILNTGACLEKTALPEKHSNSYIRREVRDGSESSHSGTRLPLEKVDKTSTKSDLPRTERTDYDIQKEKKEHAGAARRIFANALGFQPRNGGNNASKSRMKKETLE